MGPSLKRPSALNFEELVLYEDNHLLVVNKPVGVLVQADATGDVTLFELAKAYIKKKYHKPAGVYLGLVHRLDRVTSGVVIFARTSKAASRLSEALRQRKIEKLYLAVVHGEPPEIGFAEDFLDWDRQKRRALLTAQGKRACLRWKRLKSGQGRSLLLLNPLTGRKHQIRAQLAARGYPIVGDFKYGSREKIAGGRGILLHAWQLRLPHPTQKISLLLEAPLPPHWPEHFSPPSGEFGLEKFAFEGNLS